MELVFVTAGGQIKSRHLESGRYVIGRDTRCDLRVPSPEVSRQHCEISVDRDAVRVRDLKSSNGTWVNSERVEESSLEAGDLIAVGPVVVVVRIEGDPGSIDPVLLYEQGRPQGESSSPREDLDESGDHPTASVPPPKLSVPDDPDSSSIVEFDFNLDEDDEDQPPL